MQSYSWKNATIHPSRGEIRASGLNMQQEIYRQLNPICIALAVLKFQSPKDKGKKKGGGSIFVCLIIWLLTSKVIIATMSI